MLKLNTPLNAPCCKLQFILILINQKMCHIHSVKQQSNLYLLTKNTQQFFLFFDEYPTFVSIRTYLPHKFIQYCNFTAHFVLSNIGLSMLFPYYIAVDSTPNRDVSKRSKKPKQNAHSKWDAPELSCLPKSPSLPLQYGNNVSSVLLVIVWILQEKCVLGILDHPVLLVLYLHCHSFTRMQYVRSSINKFYND
jgi:hypothetical protein